MFRSKGKTIRAEDAVEGEDGDVNVEGPEVDESEEFKGSKDVDAQVYFTKPLGNGFELPAGKDVRFLVGFKNNGDKDFHVDALDASIKYSQDFTYTLQNVSDFLFDSFFSVFIVLLFLVLCHRLQQDCQAKTGSDSCLSVLPF